MAGDKENGFSFERLVFLSIIAILCFIPFSKGGIETSLIVGFFSYFISRFIKKEKPFNLNNVPLAFPLLLFLLLVEVSSFRSFDHLTTARGVLRTVKYLTLYLFVTETIVSQKKFQWVIRIILIASFLGCLNGIYQIITGWDFRHVNKIMDLNGIIRVTGSFNHPNNFACYLTTVILLSIYVNDNFVWTRLRYLFWPFYFFVLFQTNSRMPIILMSLTLFIAGCFFKQVRRISFIHLIIILSIFIIYLFYDSNYFYRLVNIIFGDLRTFYWYVSLKVALTRPFFGSGINTFMNVLGQTPEMIPFGDARFIYAHNFFLQLLVETGIFGLASFLFVLWRFFIRAKNYLLCNKQTSFQKSILGVLVGICFFLLHSLVDNNLQSLQLTTFFWVLVGSVMGITREQNLKKISSPPSS